MGQIITFYSYKGGTGRTMALANTACLLAEQQTNNEGKGVLMIDWDLEAPGLHRYFQKYLPEPASSKFAGGRNNNVDGSNGVIDLFYEIERLVDQEKASASVDHDQFVRTEIFSPGSETMAREVFSQVDIDRFITKTRINGLSLMKAGNFDNRDPDEYGERINTFNWEELYNKSPHLIRVFTEILAERYDYVLIDSRTGVTDVSGICTTLLPEKLVIVFTPNLQSLEGGLDLVVRATEYRKESADLRPLMIYPLVSRVAAEEADLRRIWRFGNTKTHLPGYQSKFEAVLSGIYNRNDVSLDNYFDEIQIQHVPRYAYGEEIAVLTDKIEDRFSLRRSYETFTNRLIKPGVPWEEKRNEGIKPRCYVIMGFGVKTDYATGRKIDLDKSYKTLIKPVVEAKGLQCLRADEIRHSASIDAADYQELLTSEVVIADISTANPNAMYQLGVRHALKPRGTIVIAEDHLVYPFDLNHIPIHSYTHLGDAIDYSEVERFRKVLGDALDHVLRSTEPDSPVYTFVPSLIAPTLRMSSVKS